MPSPGTDGAAADERIIPVILSGGAGTRLWPLSLPSRPKQMLALTDARSMLQLTAARVADPARFADPIVVANLGHADTVEAQLAEVGCAPGALILEPSRRNTAPAIALAALSVAPEALLLVMPSDHVIQRPEIFLAAVQSGAAAARDGWLVTFGIKPDRAETGYGYIRRDAAIAPGVFRAARFVEKPDAATAASYVADDRYDWNGGIFLFRADAYLAELGAHAPDILDPVQGAMSGAVRGDRRIKVDANLFSAARSRSIDHAVMEHAARVAVVPVDMGWSDVGSWDALYDIAARDEEGNAARGDVTAIDTRNCLLHSDGAQVVTIGVHDLIVVATGDTVLVLPRGSSQRVQEAVAALGVDDHAARR